MGVKNIATAYDEVALAKGRSGSQRKALAKLEKLAAERGVKLLDFDELLAKVDFWPEEESVDDFTAAVRQWRKEGEDRELP